jgi:hypothetical protein
MQFLKKNYEKILLGLVLLGLIVAVAFLPFLIASEKQRMEDQRTSIITRPVKPFQAKDLSGYEATLQRPQTPAFLDLSTTNKLFNPVRWLRAANGTIFPSPTGEEIKKLEITKIAPLYMVVALDSVSVSDSGPRYVISVEQQGALKRSQQAKRAFYTSPGEKKELFTLREVKGAADNPTALMIELAESGDLVSISKDKPYKHVDGYMADLRYGPENRTFPNRRVGSTLSFAGTEYIIVAISQNEVVMSASNGKKYTVRYSAGQ